MNRKQREQAPSRQGYEFSKPDSRDILPPSRLDPFPSPKPTGDQCSNTKSRRGICIETITDNCCQWQITISDHEHISVPNLITAIYTEYQSQLTCRLVTCQYINKYPLCQKTVCCPLKIKKRKIKVHSDDLYTYISTLLHMYTYTIFLFFLNFCTHVHMWTYANMPACVHMEKEENTLPVGRG